MSPSIKIPTVCHEVCHDLCLKRALLWGLLFLLLKRVSAQVSFRTCKRRYALLRAAQVCSRVSNKIPNCSAWQTAKWERQVEGLISEAVQQRPPIRNAFHFRKTCLMRFNAQRSTKVEHFSASRSRVSTAGNDFNRITPVVSNLTNLPFT